MTELYHCPPLAAWITERQCARNAERAAKSPEVSLVVSNDPLYTCPGCPGVRALRERGETPEPRALPQVTPIDAIRGDPDARAPRRYEPGPSPADSRRDADGVRLCPSGHRIEGENAAKRGDRTTCRQCQRAANARRREQHRARQRAGRPQLSCGHVDSPAGVRITGAGERVCRTCGPQDEQRA